MGRCLMVSRIAGLILCLTLAISGPTAGQPVQGMPPNPGFEHGLDGWTVIAPEGAAVAQPAPGAVGQAALSLRDGWVLAEPAQAAGWLRLSLRARPAHPDTAGRLMAALLASDQDGPEAQFALPASEVGEGWHQVVAELLAPPADAVRLALGVDGPEGWLIDEVVLEALERGEAPPPEDAPVVPPPLEEGWEPDGLLDALERRLGTSRELLLYVGRLEVALPARVTARRGERGAMRVTATNRGTEAKELTISVSGPQGLFVPDRTVSIRPSGTTVFDASLQCLRVGELTVRVTCRCGGEEGSAPVRLEVAPAYPAAGMCWLSGPPSDAALRAAGALAAHLHALRIPTDGAAGGLPLPGDLTRVALLGPPWSQEALQGAATALAGCADFLALHRLRGEAGPDRPAELTRELHDALQHAGVGVHALGPPFDLTAAAPPTIDGESLFVTAELAGKIAAPSLRLPALHAAAVGRVTVDEHERAVAQPCWSALSAATRLEDVASALRSQARLPLFFPELCATGTGSPEVDALVLARTLTSCVYQGATGYAPAARPSDCPPGADAFCPLDDDGRPRGVVADAYRELARELAAAVPLVVLRQTPQIGTADTAAVGFRPFMRADEGLLALWNNTGATIDLIFEVRTQPLDLHTVAIGPGGVRRSYLGAFHFSDDAIALNRPVVFVSLEPAQFKLLSMQLAHPHAAWLDSVELKPEIPRSEAKHREFFDEWERRRIDR